MAGVEVKGTQEMMRQAQQGLELLKAAEAQEIEADTAAATAFKSEIDLQIADLKQQIEQLTGKENKKARNDKSKEVSALSNTNQYVDALRILKGLPPVHGFFVKSVPAPKDAIKAPVAVEPAAPVVNEADAKTANKKAAKPKKEESAGLSKAERDELEKIKNSIIDLKKELKEEGMTGGQTNKDERVVTLVTRMNELKEKESPGSTTAGGKEKKSDEKKKKMTSAQEVEAARLTKEIEEYRQMLVTEYKYSKKEIAADPDMKDKQAALAKLTGKK